MPAPMSSQRIRDENRKFAGTGGVSQNNRGYGFVPAFCDLQTGRAEVSRFASGLPAPVHLLCGLPSEWIVARDRSGTVTAVKPSVVAGFLRNGRFFTREEAAKALLH